MLQWYTQLPRFVASAFLCTRGKPDFVHATLNTLHTIQAICRYVLEYISKTSIRQSSAPVWYP